MHSTAVVVLLLVVAACAEEPEEAPRVVNEPSAACASNERLVRDVCTELGADDGCVDVDDVCIALCDALASCTTAGGLRPLSGWPVAPDGYCVECAVP